MFRRVRPLALALVLLACQPQPAELTSVDKTALQGMVNHYVATVLAGDWDGWASQLTDDAVFLQPSGPALEGRTAIRQSIAGYAGMETFTAPVIEIAGSGSVAYARGTYAFAMGPKAAMQLADSGKWLTVYARQGDGSWRITRNIWNSDKPLPPPAPARR